ncbi:MAG TPA: NAD-dependent epimerase/dehydratase family protein [Candidatus Marinimicrobia bacterium]|nr:NAD-dependent epimerase/dehydratase family protein [Candidatus Neomarinimicrobiota bacterium]
MKCLVTGGAGFIGSNLVDRLIDDDHDVIVIDNLSTGKIENINPKAEFIDDGIGLENITDFSMFKNIDIVFHLAARARVQPSIENPLEFNRTNVDGTLNMLKASADAGVKRFVYSSSSSVYGEVKHLPTSESTQLNPMSPYALQKLIGEQYCKLFSTIYGLDTVCLRYFSVYGERQVTEGAYCLVMGIFTNQILNNKPLTINGSGKQRRDFTYVGDVVDANIKAATTGKEFGGDVFNIGNGNNRSVNELAVMMVGLPTRAEPYPIIHRPPVIEPEATLADISKAWKILGWMPSTKIETWYNKNKENLGL